MAGRWSQAGDSVAGPDSELLAIANYCLNATREAQGELNIWSGVSTKFFAVLVKNGMFCYFIRVLRECKVTCL